MAPYDAGVTEPTRYTPPSTAGAAPQPAAAPAQSATAPANASSAPGYVPPSTRTDAPVSSSAPTAPATGYRPPSTGTPSATSTHTPPAPGGALPPSSRAPQSTDADRAEAPVNEQADAEPLPPPPTRSPLATIVVGLVLLAVLGLAVAYFAGAFAPKMSRLPATAAGYARDSAAQRTTSTEYDSATYRAGAGDLYQAHIKIRGADPTIAFNKATADSRFQLDNVYCTGVSKSGKGAICSVLLPTGSALSVDGSTRHTAEDVAAFTRDLAAALK